MSDQPEDLTWEQSATFLSMVFIDKPRFCVRKEQPQALIKDFVIIHLDHTEEKRSFFASSQLKDTGMYYSLAGVPGETEMRFIHFPERKTRIGSLVLLLHYIGAVFFVEIPNTPHHFEIVTDRNLWTIIGLLDDSVLITDKIVAKTIASVDSSNKPILVDYLIENCPTVASMLEANIDKPLRDNHGC